MTRALPCVVVTLIVLTFAAPAAHGAKRRLAIVVDTSSSMTGNDRQRYTVQLSQVLSDLVDTGDDLAVVRMPPERFSSCSQGPLPSLVLRLDPSNRTAFKQQLDQLIRFDTGTYFAAPIRTAISLLPQDPATQRMLVVIADSGGLGDCENSLTRELLELKAEGVTIAAINLGSSSGAFDSNPAFDFTTAALDAQGLIEAVALVYQRFLGAKRVQTGEVKGEIAVEIAPYVEEAFLVVAADGAMGAIEQAGGNPSAAGIDLNHRGGGATRGLDDVLRGYRIVRLQRPASGRWRFRAAGITESAGWMLLQDSAIGVRLISSPVVPKNVTTALEVELIDERTGKRITDTSNLPGLQVTLDVDGRKVTFRDDGQGGDRQARDGVLTASTAFAKTGDQPLTVEMQSDFLDRKVPMMAKVIDAGWRLEVGTPKRAEVDRPVSLSVTIHPVGSSTDLKSPQRIDVLTGGPVLHLRDDGQAGDRQQGDRVFSGTWTPNETGTVHLDYVPIGGGLAARVSAPLQVYGHLTFGPPVPVNFGRLESASQASGQLDLTQAKVRGAFDVQLSTAFNRKRTMLEIDPGNGWVALGGEKPVTLRVADNDRRTWPVRLRVGGCPEAHPADQKVTLLLNAVGPDGQPRRMTVPVTVEIVPDPWLHCWWPVLAAVLGLILVGIIVYGYWSPSRFPPRLGVVLSPEEDMNEGFFHPIRAHRGSGSGFYRDAAIYVCQDFRLSSKSHNALARLRADHKLVRIEPASGAGVWRQNAEGAWEQIPPGESTARFGHIYRNDPATLFFELRNA